MVTLWSHTTETIENERGESTVFHFQHTFTIRSFLVLFIADVALSEGLANVPLSVRVEYFTSKNALWPRCQKPRALTSRRASSELIALASSSFSQSVFQVEAQQQHLCILLLEDQLSNPLVHCAFGSGIPLYDT